MAAGKTLIYVGPADKLDMRNTFGADEKYVMYPEGSAIAGLDQAEAGRETTFTDEEIEELVTNPSLEGHRFTALTADEVKARETARKARQERAARLAKAAEQLQDDGPATQPKMMLNGMPLTTTGAMITEPSGELSEATKEARAAANVPEKAPNAGEAPSNTAVRKAATPAS